VSCLIWNGLLIWAGSKVGENWGMIIGMLKKYNAVMAVVLAVGAAVWIARSILQRRAQREGEKKY
jgi:membrane protein DedA with SNARE-associated domain